MVSRISMCYLEGSGWETDLGTWSQKASRLKRKHMCKRDPKVIPRSPQSDPKVVQLFMRKVSQGRTRSHKVSQGPARSQKVSQGLTRSHKVSQGLTRPHKVSQGLTRPHKVSLATDRHSDRCITTVGFPCTPRSASQRIICLQRDSVSLAPPSALPLQSSQLP